MCSRAVCAAKESRVAAARQEQPSWAQQVLGLRPFSSSGAPQLSSGGPPGLGVGRSRSSEGCKRSSLEVVNDRSSHWLPLLAAAQQKQGKDFIRIAEAMKGNCNSADPERMHRRAVAAVARAGCRLPRAAVLVFQAE